MTLSQNALNTGARWEVRWLGKKGLVRKRFDDDFGAALKFYCLLREGGKKVVTLRSCNVGFPPPKRITEHEVQTWEVVTRRGKKYKRRVTTTVDLMEEYNLRGIWWCPYCIKLRKFKQIKDEFGRPLTLCPVCDISNWDWYVKRYNPQAKIIEYRKRRTRGRVRRRTK